MRGDESQQVQDVRHRNLSAKTAKIDSGHAEHLGAMTRDTVPFPLSYRWGTGTIRFRSLVELPAVRLATDSAGLFERFQDFP